MANQIIVSTRAFWGLINRCIDDGRLTESLVSIEVSKGRFMLLDVQQWINVECKGEWEAKVSYDQIIRLVNLFQIIDDQPVTITFYDSRIGLSEIII